MKYRVRLSPNAEKQLSKLDKHIAKMISSWIYGHLVDCENPRQYGKPLVENRSGQWRYRVGDYRIIAEIEAEELVILVIEIGHRRYVY